MFCRNCGQQLPDGSLFCPRCGTSVQAGASPVQDKTRPSPGIAVLSFFFPIVGLILYLVWMDSEPGKAKSAGKGALIGVIVSAALFMLLFIIGLAVSSSAIYYNLR